MTRSRNTVIPAMLIVATFGCSEDSPLLSVAYVHGGTFRARAICWHGIIDRGCVRLQRHYPYKRLILWLGPFWADTRLVRTSQFEECQEAGACGRMSRPEDRLPPHLESTKVDYARVPSWEAANYCRWRGWRLATPDEYERMISWTDGRQYAWGGDEWIKTDGRKPTPEGLLELHFNGQWVATPRGAPGTMGDQSFRFLFDVYAAAAFRCVYTPPWDPTPGVARIVDPAGDPWVKGGPDW